VPVTNFGRLLSSLRQLELDGGPKYRYASAGGLYPVITYLTVKPNRVEGLSAGSYYYDGVEHKLIRVADYVPDGEVYNVGGLGFLINGPTFESSAFGIFLVIQFGSIVPVYRQAALKFAAIEAGGMAHMLDEYAATCDIGLCHVGEFDASNVAAALGLAESDFVFHHLLGGGREATGDVDEARDEFEV
jgi:SagB-type dehydrogenase family enzyme